MAKKKSAASAGPHKKHGPKKRMFHSYNKCLRAEMGHTGMLRKCADDEAEAQSIDSKNKKKAAA